MRRIDVILLCNCRSCGVKLTSKDFSHVDSSTWFCEEFTSVDARFRGSVVAMSIKREARFKRSSSLGSGESFLISFSEYFRICHCKVSIKFRIDVQNL